MWQPASEAPGEVADVLKSSDTDAMGKNIDSWSGRKSEIVIDLHTVQLVKIRLSAGGCCIRPGRGKNRRLVTNERSRHKCSALLVTAVGLHFVKLTCGV